MGALGWKDAQQASCTMRNNKPQVDEAAEANRDFPQFLVAVTSSELRTGTVGPR